MSIREDRLYKELARMEELTRASTLIEFEARGTPPDEYMVVFRCTGMASAEQTRGEHLAHIYLHTEHPRLPPQVSILTPSFHPNIAALFQMPPFQASMEQMLAAAPDEATRRRLLGELMGEERFFRSHVCLDTLDRNWSPSITLDVLVLELGELIQYKRHNVDDPLNLEAAQWTRRNLHRLPVDPRELLDSKALDGIRILGERPGAGQEIALRLLDEEEIGALRPDR
jgi:ubiquitin-protein ligase